MELKSLKSETMKNGTAIEKLKRIVTQKPSGWLEDAKQRESSQEWSIKSARIALLILHEIKSRKDSQEMTQKFLAAKMGVSPQYVNKIIKGQENLSLETITKIEKALGITLVEIPSFRKEFDYDSSRSIEFIFTKVFEMQQFSYNLSLNTKLLNLPEPDSDIFANYSMVQNIQSIIEISNRFPVSFNKQFSNFKSIIFKENEKTESPELENLFA